MDKNYRCGIDIGSTAIKAALLDRDGNLIATEIQPTGGEPARNARQMWENFGRPTSTVATGYGRELADFAIKKITEISCHARGIKFLFPAARSFIDVGGQDSKAARLTENGCVDEFAMNDKCAAGAGSFLEMIARRFSLPFAAFAEIAAKNPLPDAIEINSTCAVFAESEIVGLLSRGENLDGIIVGAHFAAAKRIAKLFAQVHGESPTFFSGGGARNPLLKIALEKIIGHPLSACPESPFAGAIGAALFGKPREE